MPCSGRRPAGRQGLRSRVRILFLNSALCVAASRQRPQSLPRSNSVPTRLTLCVLGVLSGLPGHSARLEYIDAPTSAQKGRPCAEADRNVLRFDDQTLFSVLQRLDFFARRANSLAANVGHGGPTLPLVAAAGRAAPLRLLWLPSRGFGVPPRRSLLGVASRRPAVADQSSLPRCLVASQLSAHYQNRVHTY
jgi:hypothetical protein